ncbi:alpha/beta hydrolase [Actinoplanes subtropicus]|uniref:alpha/beta hydrolase n=1 Tax=Actinoplanes subtropicus TaxID=543632 RepID=UPI0004C2B6D7|nr:alpha/beta hydrolase [Actinoplanes subtropicus]
MRILPIFVALALLLPVPTTPVVSAPEKVTHLAAFTEAYRETAVRMLAIGCPYATWAAQGRHFLFFDPHGDGETAEVFGDLNTASRIAILVPGVATTLVDFDRGLGGVARRAPGVQGRTLYQQLSKRDRDVAVISWLGYDPPEGLGLAAATEGRAQAGARRLVTFVRDVLRQRPDATVTLIGHSYGSLVVGLAARDLPEVPDVIALGSPGMGVSHAADLGGAHIWSALAPHDWIRRLPQVRVLGLGLGRRPSSAGFGATALPTDGVAGHDYYLVEGSATLRAVTDVVLSGGTRHEAATRVS